VEVTALLEYLRDIEIKKLTEQKERKKEQDANSSALQRVGEILGSAGVLPNLQFLSGSAWLNGGSSQQEGITSSDIDTFRGMAAQIELAAQRGTAKGVSGIKVTLDGVAVGRLMAPIVSQMIARDIG
jgi:hypothetical protein